MVIPFFKTKGFMLGDGITTEKIKGHCKFCNIFFGMILKKPMDSQLLPKELLFYLILILISFFYTRLLSINQRSIFLRFSLANSYQWLATVMIDIPKQWYKNYISEFQTRILKIWHNPTTLISKNLSQKLLLGESFIISSKTFF